MRCFLNVPSWRPGYQRSWQCTGCPIDKAGVISTRGQVTDSDVGCCGVRVLLSSFLFPGSGALWHAWPDGFLAADTHVTQPAPDISDDSRQGRTNFLGGGNHSRGAVMRTDGAPHARIRSIFTGLYETLKQHFKANPEWGNKKAGAGRSSFTAAKTAIFPPPGITPTTQAGMLGGCTEGG